MIKLSKDVPQFLIDMLDAVDYSKITASDYAGWMLIIKENIGNHLKLKTSPKPFMLLDYPIRQDLCDLLNGYDFSSLSLMKQATLIPLAKKWANANLPLKKRL